MQKPQTQASKCWDRVIALVGRDAKFKQIDILRYCAVLIIALLCHADHISRCSFSGNISHPLWQIYMCKLSMLLNLYGIAQT